MAPDQAAGRLKGVGARRPSARNARKAREEGLSVQSGTVKGRNQANGFGSTTLSDGRADVFVPFSIREGEGLLTLAESHKVELAANRGPKRMQAACMRSR